MKKILLAVFLSLCAASLGHAQATSSVSASHIQGLNGANLVSGSLCFQATDQSDNNIGVEVSGGGTVVFTPFCTSVTNGAISAFNVPNPSTATPLNVRYRITVTQGSRTIARFPLAYLCNQSGSCTAPYAFSFDTCLSSGACISNPVPIATGPVGATGPQGPTGPPGSGSATVTITNAASTGTVLNQLAKLTGTPSTAVRTATTDTGGIQGICTANCGTSSSATIQVSGGTSCIFDGATVSGDYVENSPNVAGDCTDAGPTFPVTGQIIGKVLSTNASGGTYNINLFSTEIRPISGQAFKGNSPWSDIAAFNAIATNGPFQPTADCTSGNPQITVSNGSAFPQNGVGITVQGCGASVTMSTPSAPTVTPQYPSFPIRDHLLNNSPTGSSTYIYCIVAEDKGQGLTPCSSTTTITNGPATLGQLTATITSESLSNGTLTVNTSSGTFVNAMMVDVVSGVPRFSGMMKTNTGTTNSFTVTKYVNDDRVTQQILTDTPNSTSATGTVYYFQANTIKWTVVTGARRYWICAQRPADSSLHVIGQSDMSSTSNGWQGNQFEDWGSTFMAGQSWPFYITDAICTGAGQPDSLTTTVLSGAGTTTPTLAVAPSQTNNTNTLKARLDSGPALVAAAAQAGNNQGCVYIPPQSSVLNAFRIESYTTLAAGICIIQAGGLQLDDTLELNNAVWMQQSTGATGQFAVQGGAPVAEQTANPAIHLVGTGSSIRGIAFTSTANGATMITTDNTGFKLSTISCTLSNANDTLGICVQMRGINGGTAPTIINDGSYFAGGLSQVQDATWTPIIDDGPAQNGSGTITGANGFELHIQDYNGSRNTIGYSGGGFLSLTHVYIQGPITPLVMFSSAAGGGVIPIYLNDVIGDTTGVAMVGNINNVVNLAVRFDGLISSSITNPIISGTRPLSVSFNAWAPSTTGSFGNIENFACIPTNMITGPYESGGSPPSAVAHNMCANQSMYIQGGGYPLIGAVLPAPATPSVSGPTAGGSIPLSTYQYAVSATGWDNGDTFPSAIPSSTITTTLGNQTVTVSWTAVIGAKSYNIWRCDTAAAGGCFTNINGNLPFIGPNWKEVAFHQTGTSFVDTVASPSSSTFAVQTATGLAGMNSTMTWGLSLFAVPVTFAQLPAASASNAGQIRQISDSTNIASEGQNCTGGSSNTALAFSNGSVWKCF